MYIAGKKLTRTQSNGNDADDVKESNSQKYSTFLRIKLGELWGGQRRADHSHKYKQVMELIRHDWQSMTPQHQDLYANRGRQAELMRVQKYGTLEQQQQQDSDEYDNDQVF